MGFFLSFFFSAFSKKRGGGGGGGAQGVEKEARNVWFVKVL
jgi:hypothetical protein